MTSPASPSPPAAPSRLLPWRYLLTLLVLLGISCATVWAVAQVVRTGEQRSLDAEAENRASALAGSVQDRIDRALSALIELRRQWDIRNLSNREWNDLATRQFKKSDCGYVSAARIRWDGQPSWQYPEKSPPLRESALARDGRWGEAFELARAHNQDIATRVLTPSSQVGIVLVPLRPESSGAPGNLLVGVIDLRQLAAGLVPDGPCQQCRVEIREDGQAFLALGSAPRANTWPRQRSVQFLNRTWELRYYPDSGHNTAARGAAGWVLGAGLPACVLGIVLLHEALVHRRRSAFQTARYLAALESLNEISAATASKIGSTDVVLRQLADASRQLLGMRVAGVAQLCPRTGQLHLRAVSGDMPPGARRGIPIADLPLVRKVLETGEILLEEDVDRIPGLNPDINREFGVRGLALIPIHLDGRRVGLLAICDPSPRVFTSADRRLASLLASHAEVILANNSMYEQMRGMLQVRDRLLDAQEELYRTSVAMYHAGSLAESLRALAERAPVAVPADLCMVLLLRERESELEVVAACGEAAPRVLARRLSLGENLLDARQPRFIDDSTTESTTKPLFADSGGGTAQAHLPLLDTERNVLGVLVLCRKAPAVFTPAERALAQVFAERAAAGIENARLQDQTRRDAEARALLLSELHHRVKNNLAGIIGLLSMDTPDVSEPARQWLDRVIERIGAMARAHDLFAGGLDKLPLNRLIEQVVPGLSVLRPHSVPICVDAQGEGAVLGPSQAVSLAMVLHELCANALQHAQGSPVCLHASHYTGLARVQVTDHGPGPGAAGSNGVGLTLVRELVRRELKGSFTLGPAQGGGTVAEVQFPVEQNS